ncbi:MAG: PA14 domain-containing protein [Planctomycetota bacterium]
MALVAVVVVSGAAPAQAASPAEASSPRGFDPEYLLATYYDDAHLNPASELLTRREDEPIDFYLACWGEEWPFEGCKLIDELSDGAYYSVRWQSGLLIPATGHYTFTLANVDDGARLFIDGAPVIDQGWHWPDPDVRPSPQTLSLEAGWYPITIDYEQRPPYIASRRSGGRARPSPTR